MQDFAMFMFFSQNKVVVFIYGLGGLSLLYVTIYFGRPWFILGTIAIIGAAVQYAEAKKTRSLQDIGLGALVAFALIAAVAINAVVANVIVLNHILDPDLYREFSGNYLSLKFLYHFVLPLFWIFILAVHLGFPGESGFQEACVNGDVKTVERVLRGGRDPNRYIEFFHIRTPMRVASINGRLEVVKTLVKYGADIGDAMSLAARSGHVELMDYLMAQGEHPEDGLYGAIEGKSLDMVRHLLDRGAGDFSFHHLSHAVAYSDPGNREILDLLLSRRPKWSPSDETLSYMLDDAFGIMRKKEYKPWTHILLDILFESGLSPDNRDHQDNTGLMRAVLTYDPAIVSIFLKKGADPNLVNCTHETALLKACEHNGVTDSIVEMLLEHGADPEIPNHHGNTPLNNRYGDDKENILLLIKYGANVHHRDNEGRTVLHQVCRKRENRDIVRILLDNGLDIDIRDTKGMTPLMTAVWWEDTGSMADFLIKCGAIVNARDNTGMTPLMYAADHRNEASAKILLQEKADVNVRDKDGKTALIYAEQAGMSEMMTLLKNHGASKAFNDNEDRRNHG
jgi:ankyrin repeat protein